MVRKGLLCCTITILCWSCATYSPPAPSFYLEDIPQEVSSGLTLDQRIAAEEAWVSLREGRGARAEKLLIDLGTESPLYWVGRGYVYLLGGDSLSAENAFLEAERLSPEMTLANIGLAQIYEARGQRDLLYSQYLEILKNQPGNRWAKPRFETLRNELVESAFAESRAAQLAGNREGSKTALLKVLFYNPGSTEANLELARLYRKEENVPSALVHMRTIIEKEPENKAALREYAELLLEGEEFGLSLETFEKLLEQDPQDKVVRQKIEDLKNRLGVFEPPSQYNVIPSIEAITREDLAALVGVKFHNFIDVSGMKPRILVDISTSWAQTLIVQITSLDIMSSFDNHTFQPKKIINRAEMAGTLVRLIDYLNSRGFTFVPLVEARRIQINDVSEDNFYYRPITRIVSYQIMDLSPLRTFEPEKTVSGREAIRLLDIVVNLAK